jgi:hypothetical protein
LWTFGFSCFIGGYLVAATGWVLLGNPSDLSTRRDPGDFTDLIYAIFQTFGMLAMTLSDLSVNLFLRRNSRRAALFISLWAVYYAFLVITGNNPAFAVTFPVFLYALIRWRSCIEMKPGYPLLTEVFMALLALDLVGHGGYWLVSAHTNAEQWPSYLVFVCYLSGTLLVFFSHRVALQRDDTPTMALNTAMYSYLFFVGFFYLLYAVLFTTVNNWNGSIAVWLIGPIHLLPTGGIIIFRRSFRRRLGKRWLEMGSKKNGFQHIAKEQDIAPEHGNLAAVEAALAAQNDLNEHNFHLGTYDEFTLLILACFNGHEDAVNLLLSQESVLVNKGSLHQNWSPLYVAAMGGHSSIAALLIRHGADVHATSTDGECALLVATMNGHTQIIQQLMEEGARKVCG